MFEWLEDIGKKMLEEVVEKKIVKKTIEGIGKEMAENVVEDIVEQVITKVLDGETNLSMESTKSVSVDSGILVKKGVEIKREIDMMRFTPWIIIVSMFFMLASLFVPWFRWYKDASCTQICLNCTIEDLDVEKGLLERFPYDALGGDRIGTLHIGGSNESTIVTISQICFVIIIISFILAPLTLFIENSYSGCAGGFIWLLLFIVVIVGFLLAVAGAGLSQEFPDFRIDTTKLLPGAPECAWQLRGFVWQGPIFLIIGVLC